LFSTESTVPACWRPDLVPAILKWVESLPDSAWQHCVGFAVEEHGGFICEFEVTPSDGSAPVAVTHQFDHTYHHIATDVGIWREPRPQPFHTSQLVGPANLV
jgi:hypothetical protein